MVAYDEEKNTPLAYLDIVCEDSKSCGYVIHRFGCVRVRQMANGGMANGLFVYPGCCRIQLLWRENVSGFWETFVCAW